MRGDEIRVFNEIVTPDVDDFTEENGELKPMKEFIDLECHRQKTNPDKDYEIRPATADGDDLDSPFDKHFKEIAGRFWEAASIFSKKLGEMESEAEEEERGVTAAATGAKRRRNLGNDGSHRKGDTKETEGHADGSWRIRTEEILRCGSTTLGRRWEIVDRRF
ncbi:hypothetical protein LINPERHAP2_LOCUS1901 [Linum perenne]